MPLGLPYDTAPLHAALVTALTTDVTGAARPRALTSTRLFVLGKPADHIRGTRPSQSFGGVGKRGRPIVWVSPIATAPIDSTLQMSDRARRDAAGEIRCWYYAHDIDTDAWRDTVAEIHRDRELVTAALCYPGALYTVSASDTRRTGLDSGCLDISRWRALPVIPLPQEPRVLQATYTFTASVELSAPEQAVGSNP